MTEESWSFGLTERRPFGSSVYFLLKLNIYIYFFFHFSQLGWHVYWFTATRVSTWLIPYAAGERSMWLDASHAGWDYYGGRPLCSGRFGARRRQRESEERRERKDKRE